MARAAARQRWSPGSPEAPAVRALGWTATASGDRKSARLPPYGPLRRRADREPRLGHERRGPRARPALGRRARPDDRDGHPRRIGRDDRRPRPLPRGRSDRQVARPALAGPGDRRDPGGGRTMTGVALRGLLARRVRAVLTALAIVLGVAMVSGSFVLTDTISKAFDSIFTSSYSHTDAVVSGKKLVDYSNGGKATVSQSLLDPDRPAAARPGRLLRHLGRGESGRLLRHAGLGAQARAAADRAGANGQGAGERGQEGRRKLHQLHPRLPARFRRDRALRRRVRDLQHAFDHGRATDPRAGDAADARRLAAAGAPVGGARVVRDRATRFGDRPRLGLRAREGAELALRRARAHAAAGQIGRAHV